MLLPLGVMTKEPELIGPARARMSLLGMTPTCAFLPRDTQATFCRDKYISNGSAFMLLSVSDVLGWHGCPGCYRGSPGLLVVALWPQHEAHIYSPLPENRFLFGQPLVFSGDQ